MSLFRTKALRRSILDAVSMAGGYALPDETLRKHVGDLERPQPTDEEWSTHTDWLEVNDHLVRVPSALDETLVQWAITEKGRTLLKTL